MFPGHQSSKFCFITVIDQASDGFKNCYLPQGDTDNVKHTKPNVNTSNRHSPAFF